MLKSKAIMFAEAFLFGATRGDWALSANVAGYAEMPKKDNFYIAEALEKLKDRAEKVEIVEEIEKVRGKIDWTTAADEIAPIMLQIASGEIKASPAQLRAINEIITRGQGKVVEKQKKLEAPAIVILPTLGERETIQVCPNCMGELE